MTKVTKEAAQGDPLRRRRLVLIAAESLLLFAAAVLLGRVYYELNDDETFNLMLAGAYGPFSNIVYMNILLSKGMAFLFRVFPAWNWYLVLMLGMNFMALLLLTLVLTEQMDEGAALVTTAGLHLLFDFQLFNELQYTKNAAFYTVVGAVLFFHALEAGRHRDGWTRGRCLFLAAGSLLFVLGFMVRPESFAAACPFVLVRLLLFFWQNRRDAVRLLRFLALPALLLLLVIVVDKAAAGTDPEWREYLRFHEARVALLDHGMPDYALHREELSDLGFDELDLQMFRKYLYADWNKFNADSLESLVALRDEEGKASLRINRTVVGEALRHMVEAAGAHLIAGAMLLFFVLSILLLKGPDAYAALVMLAGVGGEYWYLACTNRFAWRAEFGLWTVPLLLLLSLLAERRGGLRTERLLPGLLAACLLAGAQLGYGMHVFYFDKDASALYEEADISPLIEAISSGDDLYMLDTMSIANTWILSPVQDITGRCRGLFHNIGFLGGWAGTSPYGRYYLRQRGMDNGILALLEDRVYLADNSGSEDMILAYLRKEYDPEAVMEPCGDIGGFHIFAFHPGKNGSQSENEGTQ